MKIAQQLDDKAQLNPSWLSGFLIINKEKKVPKEPVQGLCMNYTFKIDSLLHKHIKLIAIENDLPVNEFIARLLEKYYR
jgi:predicted HicB family RNase H-like nuclease